MIQLIIRDQYRCLVVISLPLVRPTKTLWIKPDVIILISDHSIAFAASSLLVQQLSISFGCFCCISKAVVVSPSCYWESRSKSSSIDSLQMITVILDASCARYQGSIHCPYKLSSCLDKFHCIDWPGILSEDLKHLCLSKRRASLKGTLPRMHIP